MSLPLYPVPPSTAVELAAPRDRQGAACHECALGGGCVTNCMAAEVAGAKDGPTLLVVAGSPTMDDDRRGRPFVSKSGDWMRGLLARHWRGPVVLDHALKCAAGREPPDGSYDACRPYLRAVMNEAKPDRIIMLGTKAAIGVVGQCPPLDSVRRAYTHVGGVPAFFLQDASYAMRNKFVRRQFEEDLAWALMENTSPTKAPVWQNYVPVRTTAHAREAWEQLRVAPWLAFDTETSGAMYTADFRVLTVAVADPGGRCYVWEQGALDDANSYAFLEQLLDGGPPKVGQNVKYDLQAMAQIGVAVRPVGGDTRIQRRLLSSESLAALDVQQWMVGMGGGKDEAEIAGGKLATEFKRRVNAARKKGLPPAADERLVRSMDLADSRGGNRRNRKGWYMALLDPELRARYCALDTVSTARVHSAQLEQLDAAPDIRRTWADLVLPSVGAYTRMEQAGIRVNLEKARRLAERIRQRQAPIIGRLLASPAFEGKDEAGMRTALNSPQQRCALLYDYLKLPLPDGRRSSDKDALAALGEFPPDHEVTWLRQWNELEKMRATYADGLPPFVGADGRVHPSFNVDGTRAGRTSCDSPNLQNIPRARSDLARDCKDVFEAAPGYRLVQLDYSQLELRVACMLSGDQVMEEIFASGEDYHLRTGRILFEEGFLPPRAAGAGPSEARGQLPWKRWDDVPPEVQKIYRDDGKTFNFALVFQQGDGALARNMKASKDAAGRVRAAILGRLKALRAWMARTIEAAKREGCVWTYWDGRPARRRFLHDLGEPNREKSGHAERQAGNTPIQGSANEFKIASVVAIDRWLREDAIPARVVLEVHDSVMLEVRADDVGEVVPHVRAIMEGWPPCGPGRAPLKVDVEVGDSWGSMAKL